LPLIAANGQLINSGETTGAASSLSSHQRKNTMHQLEYKIMDHGSCDEQVHDWRTNKQRVVFTNGVFDLLHRGHIDYLLKASQLGDKLVVGINNDASVKQINKGTSRPIKDEYSRALIMAALYFVDAVVVFSEPTPLNLIEIISPDVLVKGGDYSAEETNPDSAGYIVGSDHVKQKGGTVKVIPFLPGYSTTALEQKIIDAHLKK